MRPTPARIVGLAAAVSIGLALPAPLYAQDTTAEAVFEEGVKLFEAGDFAAACPKLKSAVKLSSSEALGGRLLLADCYEKQGRWASAWGLYREIAPKAAASGQAARRDKAEAGRARVEPKLARVKIVLGPGVVGLPGLSLDRDGEVIPREAWDVALPVDPGEVVITASATGKQPAKQSVRIEDAPTTSTVRMDRLEDAPTTGAAPSASSGVTPDDGPLPPAEVAPPSADEDGLGSLGVAGIVIGGVGLVGIGVSAIVAASARSSWDDAVVAKDDQGVDDARGTGNAATGVFVAGAVLAAVGTTLLVIDLARASSPSSARGDHAPRWKIRTAGLGARAEGTF